ncbi:hypothetical protein LWI29_011175 [Acer saccharum]|uniref:Uncharacterized protein n=1 Tax=Acer saccharum TaxID=4024 RepID=A0AA39S795_ACESA|nr:hypothetical protein LWI29_011175 [Acer saccharum]
MLNIEEVVDRVGFQLSEILQEVEKEKEEPPRLSQPTYPLCSHEEESVPTPSSSEDDIYEAYMHFADELKKEEEEKRIDVTYGVRHTRERKRGRERTLSLFFLSIISRFSFKDKYCGSQKLEDTLRLGSMANGFHLELYSWKCWTEK